MKLYRKSCTADIACKLLVINEIEEKFRITLPKCYRIVQMQYDLGQYSEVWDAYIDKFLRTVPLSEIFFDNRSMKLSYGWFFSLEELELDLEYCSEQKRLWLNHDVIRIGNIVSGGGLYLGVGENNKDYIYKMVWDHDKKPIRVCDNIFNFISNLQVRPIDPSEKVVAKVGKLFPTVSGIDYPIKKDVLSSVFAEREATGYTNKASMFLNLEKIITNVRDTNF